MVLSPDVRKGTLCIQVDDWVFSENIVCITEIYRSSCEKIACYCSINSKLVQRIDQYHKHGKERYLIALKAFDLTGYKSRHRINKSNGVVEVIFFGISHNNSEK